MTNYKRYVYETNIRTVSIHDVPVTISNQCGGLIAWGNPECLATHATIRRIDAISGLVVRIDETHKEVLTWGTSDPPDENEALRKKHGVLKLGEKHVSSFVAYKDNRIAAVFPNLVYGWYLLPSLTNPRDFQMVYIPPRVVIQHTWS